MKTLEQYVSEAVGGNKVSLEVVVKDVQDMIYNLALRMLWHPEDAKDATQEILIKLVTNLSKFEHRSSFKTWVYRLASNELLNFKGKFTRNKINFDDFQSQLSYHQNDQLLYTQNTAEQSMLIREAKVGCSHAMLQCLDNENRLTYVIGEILEFDSQEAAIILDIKPDAFRKRLSRVRKTMNTFVRNNCGLVNSKNSCRCYKRVDANIKAGIINPHNLLFNKNAKEQLVDRIDKVMDEVALFQSNPNYNAPDQLLNEVKRIVTASGI